VRVKIKASSDQQYKQIASELRGVHIYASSPRRRFFSTDELPPAVQRRVAACGGQVVVDRKYTLGA
jgi:hypothetical protein